MSDTLRDCGIKESRGFKFCQPSLDASGVPHPFHPPKNPERLNRELPPAHVTTDHRRHPSPAADTVTRRCHSASTSRPVGPILGQLRALPRSTVRSLPIAGLSDYWAAAAACCRISSKDCSDVFFQNGSFTLATAAVITFIKSVSPATL
jgi:hypothetical protein